MMVIKQRGQGSKTAKRPAVRLVSTDAIGNFAAFSLLLLNLLTVYTVTAIHPELPLWLLSVFYGLAAVVFFVTIGLRILIIDLYRQLNYRDRFVLFVFLVAIAFIPSFFRHGDSEIILLGLLLLQSFFAAEARLLGRLILLAMLAVAIALMKDTDVITPLHALGFLVLLPLCIRLHHLHARLDQFHEESGVVRSALIRKSLPFLLIPVTIGFLFELLTEGRIARRNVSITYTPEQIAAEPSSLSTFLLQLLILGGLVAGVVILLRWLESKLRRSRPKLVIGDVAEEGVFSLKADDLTEEIPLVLDGSEGPREKIIKFYENYEKNNEKSRLARKTSIPVTDHLDTIAEENLKPVAIRAAQLFREACYSENKIDAKDADFFEEALEELRASQKK